MRGICTFPTGKGETERANQFGSQRIFIEQSRLRVLQKKCTHRDKCKGLSDSKKQSQKKNKGIKASQGVRPSEVLQ